MGVALGIRYLMGWALATHPASRELPEWPPHPDRVFMALAAAYFETGGDSEERAALEWLERQPPPAVHAGWYRTRKVVTTYVPVNDTQAPRLKPGGTPSADQIRAGLMLLPTHRNRQARQFPTALLDDEIVHLSWEDTPEEPLLSALQRVCQKVTRVGHSASLAQMWVHQDIIPEHYRQFRPTEQFGMQRLRVTGPGRLQSLKSAFEAGRKPSTSLYRVYTEEKRQQPERAVLRTIFSEDMLVLTGKSGSRKFQLHSTLLLSQNLHKTLLAHLSTEIAEWVSGHRQDGSRSEECHLALVPLAHVGRRHAEGHLLGYALAVPGAHKERIAGELGRALIDQTSYSVRDLVLKMGALGDWTLAFEQRDELPLALQPETWTASPRGCNVWASVTPIVMDRHSKGAASNGWREGVAQSCERIGLPAPQDIEISKVSLFQGAPTVYEFPPLLRKDGSFRQHVHCVLTFDKPIVGPMLLGAGRYRGYGLLRPVWTSGGGQ